MRASPRAVGRWLAAAIVALAVATAAPAQVHVVSDVEVSVDSPWPAAIGKGYFPVWVELENQLAVPRLVEVALECDWGRPNKTVRWNVQLEGREKRELELFAPAFTRSPHSAGRYEVRVSVGREDVRFPVSSASNAWDPSGINLLIVTPSSVAAGAQEALVQELADDALVRAIPVTVPSRSARGRAGGTTAEVVPTRIWPGSMPSHFQSYSSLDVVLLDARKELPASEQLDPLLAWVQTGGRLCVFGEDAFDELRASEGIGAALEPRFVLEELAGGARVFRVGLGRLLVVPGGPRTRSAATNTLLVEEEDVHALAALIATGSGGRQPHAASEAFGGRGLAIPGLGSLPLRVFLVLLFLFALVIGPANLVFLKRVGRPGLLLATIPLISIVASVGILAYGMFYQGIDVKAASRSWTVLDQRTHRAATVEQRATFVGLSSGSGLHPEPGTAVFPLQLRDEQRYYVDFTRGLALQGSYLPVRELVEQCFLREASARGRLNVSKDGTKIEVQNALDANVTRLVLRDDAGDWYVLEDRLPPGASATLRSGGKLPPEELPFLTLADERSSAKLELLPATYFARISRSPFIDTAQVELNMRAGEHWVEGILPADSRDW